MIVETKPDGCIDFDLMTRSTASPGTWQNVEGVQDVDVAPGVAKIVIAGWNEGSLKWRNMPRDERQLVQSHALHRDQHRAPQRDCSVMPVMLFLQDHRAETIERVVAAVKEWRDRTSRPRA